MEPQTVRPKLSDLARESLKMAWVQQKKPVAILIGPTFWRARKVLLEATHERTFTDAEMEQFTWQGLPVRQMQAEGVAVKSE